MKDSLYTPIITEVQNEVKHLANEKGYSLIFDSSDSNNFMKPELDVTLDVRKRLGIL